MLSAWCLVLGAWCLVLGAWCLVLSGRPSGGKDYARLRSTAKQTHANQDATGTYKVLLFLSK